MHIVAVNTHPCEQCQRLGFDPPWQLVAELTYTCARKGSVRTTLCLSRHLAEFLAEYADGTRSDGDTNERTCWRRRGA